MAQRIQVRRGTAAAATAANPVLSAGEFGYETDTGKVKIGNGVTAWTALPYLGAAGNTPTVLAARTAGDLTLNQTAFTAVDTALDLTLPAVAGDKLEVVLSTILAKSGASGDNHVNFTAYTRVAGADVNNIAGGTASVPGWFAPDSLVTVSGPQIYTVQAGDISGGNVTVRLYYKINSSVYPRTLFANAGNPSQFAMKNLR